MGIPLHFCITTRKTPACSTFLQNFLHNSATSFDQEPTITNQFWRTEPLLEWRLHCGRTMCNVGLVREAGGGKTPDWKTRLKLLRPSSCLFLAPKNQTPLFGFSLSHKVIQHNCTSWFCHQQPNSITNIQQIIFTTLIWLWFIHWKPQTAFRCLCFTNTHNTVL